MPRRRDERARVLGPTWDKRKWYWRVTALDPRAVTAAGRRRDRYFATEEEAREYRDLKFAEFRRLEGVTVGDAIDRYIESRHACSERSREDRRMRLALFLASVEEKPVTAIGEAMAQRLYDEFRKGRAVDTHRNVLGNVKGWAAWCVAHGWIVENPFARVEGIGKRSTGKAQLTGDEARRFWKAALKLAHQGDDGALAAALALATGLRSGEIIARQVRDLDLDGTALRVPFGKSAAARRIVGVPAALRTLMLELGEDRDGNAPLFESGGTESGHHHPTWLRAATLRVCKAAKVPDVCPHGLRGTHATLALEIGQVASAVADALGHEEVSTTKRHYAKPDAGAAVTAERALSRLH